VGIPDDAAIRALHERHAPTPEALDAVFTHCRIVCEIAEQLHASSGDDADLSLVRAGALLHDVGVYRLYDAAGRLDHERYIWHGLLGHELLGAEGLPEALCRFASHHTGVGITRADVLRQQLPLPPADYLAETPEEALVMYADKFHTKTAPPAFLTPAAYAAYVRRFGAQQVAAFAALRAKFGDPDLTPLSAAYGQRVLGDLPGAPASGAMPSVVRVKDGPGLSWRRQSPSTGLPYSFMVSSVTLLVTSSRLQGPVLRSKSRPKPTHLPVILRPVGCSRNWMAPWYTAPW